MPNEIVDEVIPRQVHIQLVRHFARQWNGDVTGRDHVHVSGHNRCFAGNWSRFDQAIVIHRDDRAFVRLKHCHPRDIVRRAIRVVRRDLQLQRLAGLHEAFGGGRRDGRQCRFVGQTSRQAGHNPIAEDAILVTVDCKPLPATMRCLAGGL